MTEMTAAEIARAFAQNHREHDKFVGKELHDQVIHSLREDITEIKDSVKWMMRLIVTQFFGLVVAVIIFVATRGIG
jgi:hypothetical protein